MFRSFFIISLTTVYITAERLTIAHAHRALSSFMQDNPTHAAIPRISEIVSALLEHTETAPDAHFQEEIEAEIRALVDQKTIEETRASQLTIEQAHAALTSFAQKNPDHPALSRITEILKSLKEHLDTNPTAQFQDAIEQEIYSLIGPINAQKNIFQYLTPWIIRGGFLIIVYKFIRSFLSDQQIAQLQTVQAEAHQVDALAHTILHDVQVLQSGDRSLSASAHAAADRVAKLFNDEVLAILDTHDTNIIRLRDELLQIQEIIQRITQFLGLPQQESQPGCCIPKRRVRGG